MSTLSVYTGRWTDWSKGAVLGDQITLPNSSANILVAFIAIFITFVGIVAWNLVAYAVHQLLVSPGPQDGLHWQILATLRTGYSPDIFAWRMLRLGLAWRGRPVPRALSRTLGFAALALILYGGFIAAGILLSMISSSGEVLLRSAHCGLLNISAVEISSAETQWQFYLADNVWGAESISQAYAYAQVCYPSANISGELQQIIEAPASDCGFYSRATLNWTTEYPASCPFADKALCREDAIRFDTGYLDTNDDLGRNSKNEDRVRFRRVTTCAPMVTDGYSTDGFVNDSVAGRVAIYNYGQNFLQPLTSPYNPNATFYYSYESYLAGNLPYEILFTSTDIQSTGVEMTSAFFPDERVAPNGTSVTLLFLANRVSFSEPVEDPWFNATAKLPMYLTNGSDPGTQFYVSSAPGAVVGCINEYEICNPNLPADSSCISFAQMPKVAFGEDLNSLASLKFNTHQSDMATVVGNVLYDSGMWNIVNILGQQALAATEYLYPFSSQTSLPLPPTQWIAEMQRLQAASLAAVQRSAYMHVAGPSDPALIHFLEQPAWMEWMCANQKYNSSDYSSFSVLGLGLVFGLGGTILLLGALLKVVIPHTQRRGGKGGDARRRRHEQWATNDVLYLQRTVLEDRGLGKWEGEINEVPTIEDSERFVAFTDVSYPRNQEMSIGRDAGVVPEKRVRGDVHVPAYVDLEEQDLGARDRPRNGQRDRLLDGVGIPAEDEWSATFSNYTSSTH